jgi:hypothetical protein
LRSVEFPQIGKCGFPQAGRAAYGSKDPGSSRPKRTAERFATVSAHFIGQKRARELADEFMGASSKNDRIF